MPRADGGGPSGDQPRSAAGVPAEQVRDALAHLYDPAHLQTHPLAALVAPSPAAPSAGRALRETLLDVVDALRPERGGAPNARATRRHGILRLRYVEGRPVDEILGRLTIGRSEYYREHRQAVEALASLLRERLGRRGPATGRPPPAPAAPAAAPTGALPVYLTSFVGWEAEGATLAELLAGARLLTLTGAGGCGKTRLAVHVAAGLADAYPAGVWFVDLASLADPALVPGAVLAALGLREVPGRVPAAAVAAHVRGRAALVVLDNCEHVVASCARLAEALLGACSGLRVLATSREALGVGGETVWRVPSLAAPGPGAAPAVAELTAYPAVRLFADRAAAVEPAFTLTAANAQAVVRVCRRLDGIPLALELAAVRVRVLTVEQIAARLDDRFRLLTGGSRTALPRQQTLKAAVDWSHDLLAEPERVLFRRLGVFAGGWTIECAEAVCPGEGLGAGEVLDLLTALVDKSLVVAEAQDGEERYRLLETVRQYALERLEAAGEAAAIRGRHAAHYLELAERIEPDLWRDGQRAGVVRLAEEHDNLRAALEWTIAADPSVALRLGAALWRFWHLRGHVLEGLRWLRTAPERAPADAPARAYALVGAANLARAAGDWTAARRLLDEAMPLAATSGDRRAAGLALRSLAVLVGYANIGEAEALAARALVHLRAVGFDWGVAAALNNLGLLARARGDRATGRAYHEEALRISRRIGNPESIAATIAYAVDLAGDAGEAERTDRLLDEAERIATEAGLFSPARWFWHMRGLVALARGDLERAAATFRTSIERDWSGEQGRLGPPLSLYWLGVTALRMAEPERAVRLMGAGHPAVLGPETRVISTAVAGLGPEETLEEARAAVPPDRFDALWRQGEAMTPEEAVAYALSAAVSPQPDCGIDSTPAEEGRWASAARRRGAGRRARRR